MTVCMVISLPKVPYIHRIYLLNVWFWPTLHTCTSTRVYAHLAHWHHPHTVYAHLHSVRTPTSTQVYAHLAHWHRPHTVYAHLHRVRTPTSTQVYAHLAHWQRPHTVYAHLHSVRTPTQCTHTYKHTSVCTPCVLAASPQRPR